MKPATPPVEEHRDLHCTEPMRAVGNSTHGYRVIAEPDQPGVTRNIEVAICHHQKHGESWLPQAEQAQANAHLFAHSHLMLEELRAQYRMLELRGCLRRADEDAALKSVGGLIRKIEKGGTL